MVVVFAATLFLSSSLLFVVQPMMAKMLLPLLGGSPAVWNTCMVFFQATLLAGYLYAHASTRWLRFQQQALLHICLLSASFLALPIVIARQHSEPPTTGTPIAWLLWVLLITVGLPYFLVSSSGPLLQHWFTRTAHPSARDPYFLSVAGNVGSIFALLTYPAVLEPLFRLREQSAMWTGGYLTLVLLTTACFVAVYRQARSSSDQQPVTSDRRWASDQRPRARERGYWILLAFVPSSLLLGVTTFLTTDVAAVPLFWIVPLVIYLLTFVLVFARRTLVRHSAMVRALPLLALPLAWLVAFSTYLPVPLQAPLHLLTFFVAAMVCHGELARRRPDGRHLTEFYLCMSVGGVLGGAFNALVAPLLFTTVLEYPLALVLACALRPTPSHGTAPRGELRQRDFAYTDFALPLAVGGFSLAMMFLLNAAESKGPLTLLLVFIIPTVIVFSFSRRPLRFALSLGALMLAAGTYTAAQEHVTHRGRNFFGVHRVYEMPESRRRYLVNGGIIHGMQHMEPSRRREPAMYYRKDGPIGHLFGELPLKSGMRRIGVVGLGVGALAAYSEAGQQWTFYEIDPEIADLARDARQFTYLADSPARTRIVLGDARIALTKEAASSFDLLIVDAFSSDAIPVHLLTREALHLYWEKIDLDGVLAFHISNKYLKLAPLVSDLARDAGLVCLVRTDKESEWAVMARSRDVLAPLARDSRWRSEPADDSLAWTDDFSNPLSLVRWFGK